MVLLCAAVMAAQTPAPTGTKPAASPKPAAKAAPPAKAPAKTAPAGDASAVPAEATVATLTGLCTGGAQPPCPRAITRGEFDRMIAVLKPGLQVKDRRQLAADYVQLLSMAEFAHEQKLDEETTFAERLRLQRMQLLAQLMVRRMQESSKPTDAEIETFYTENSSKFEEQQLRMVLVPKTGGDGMKPEERKAYADKLQARAVAGEDTEKLQQEVYVAIKPAGAPPKTELGWKRRGTLPQQMDSQLATLKSGEVTPVLEDGQNLYFIKVDAKRMIPLPTEQQNIERFLTDTKVNEKIRAMLAKVKVDLSPEYFGPPEPEGPQRPARPPDGQKPPAQQPPPAAPPKN